MSGMEAETCPVIVVGRLINSASLTQPAPRKVMALVMAVGLKVPLERVMMSPSWAAAFASTKASYP